MHKIFSKFKNTDIIPLRLPMKVGFMKKFILALFLLLILHACAFQHFVDKKGRDCTTYSFFWLFTSFDVCSKDTGPLAAQPYTVDANINQTTKTT